MCSVILGSTPTHSGSSTFEVYPVQPNRAPSVSPLPRPSNVARPATITIRTALTIDSAANKSLTINGPADESTLVISGADSVPVFVIQPLNGGGGLITVTISGFTIEHGSSLLGGGIYKHQGDLTLIKSTITGNSAVHEGGGIGNITGTLTLTNSTVSANSATGVRAVVGGILVKNSIFANSPAGGNCHIAAISLGYNLSDDNSCAGAFFQTGDRNNTGNLSVGTGLDPAGLKNNGGPTQTIARQIPSLAIDVIPLHLKGRP